MERKSNERNTVKVAMEAMVSALANEHPQPWHIDIKFSPEIYDANGNTFITPLTIDSAKLIVSLAAKIDNQLQAVDTKSLSTHADEPAWPHVYSEWLD